MFNQSKQLAREEKPVLHVLSGFNNKWPKINFYDNPPISDVTVEEFETSALDRMRILAEIESSAARNRTWEELKTATKTQCDRYLSMKGKEVDYKKDQLGHFVLRLAFCRSEDLRRRFVKAESNLFKFRYEELHTGEREEFLKSRDFSWIAVDSSEKARFRTELLAAYQGPRIENLRVAAFEAERFYKVSWTRVPDLVEKRRVFLRGGLAYVPGKEQSSIVFQEFESHLQRTLEATARALPRLDEDTRLMPILENLSRSFLGGVPAEWNGPDPNANPDEIKAEMVDELAFKHFPLCMRACHDKLRRDHHLKHFGRLQYGLFLKVLGLSIDEATAFWRKSFSRMTDDKFNKEYRYNIRHSYGLEGKRANYPAKSCQQILQPGASDYGCPYRHYSPENLQTALLSSFGSHGLTSTDLPEIMSIVKDGHYHVACTRVFEVTHAKLGVKKGDGLDKESVTHPNQYAARSMGLHKAQKEAAEAMIIG